MLWPQFSYLREMRIGSGQCSDRPSWVIVTLERRDVVCDLRSSKNTPHHHSSIGVGPFAQRQTNQFRRSVNKTWHIIVDTRLSLKIECKTDHIRATNSSLSLSNLVKDDPRDLFSLPSSSIRFRSVEVLLLERGEGYDKLLIDVIVVSPSVSTEFITVAPVPLQVDNLSLVCLMS